MKRFIKYLYDEWESQEEITNKDLINIRDYGGQIIDIVEGKYFDPEENSWKEIK